MASEGWNSPGTMAVDASVGTVTWTNPDNAKAEDNTNAQARHTSSGTSNYLKATKFGFSIPTGSTIDGIVAEFEKDRSVGPGNNTVDNAVRIVKGGSIGTTDRSVVGSWPASDTYVSHGGTTDKWGETWTPANINADDFGVVISETSTVAAGSVTADIDHIRITVHYTPPPAFMVPKKYWG